MPNRGYSAYGGSIRVMIVMRVIPYSSNNSDMLKSEHIPLKDDININIGSHTKGNGYRNLNKSVLCWFNIIMEKPEYGSVLIFCVRLFSDSETQRLML